MKNRSMLVSLFVALLSLGATGCVNQASQGGAEKAEYLTYVKPGELMPMTQFTDIQGKIIDLSDSRNNKLVVLFATWCPDSQRAIKAIVKRNLGSDSNLDLIAIGREETRVSLNKFARKYRTDFPLIADADRSIYSQFANAGVPRLILLDGQNHIVKTIIAEGEHPLAEVSW